MFSKVIHKKKKKSFIEIMRVIPAHQCREVQKALTLKNRGVDGYHYTNKNKKKLKTKTY